MACADSRDWGTAHVPAVAREYWFAKLANLRVDRARGDPAPHKPLLLLIVLDLAEQHLLSENLLLSPELAFRFLTFWHIVSHRRNQRPDIRLPFHHLQSDGFWAACSEGGEASPHRRLTRYAVLNPEFVAFAQDPVSRDKARRILIARYFQPEERLALYTLVGLAIPSDDEIAHDAAYKLPDSGREQGREARFRITVVAAYDYTCALTGYRPMTIIGGSIVDAAHIHQFADSRNNDPSNGLALCKNAHWLFDQGLWTISDDYRVIIAAGHFSEQSLGHKGLYDYHGEKIHLPADSKFWPKSTYLSWHRKNVFQGE
jgi:putative restriction endonuclease